MVIENDPIDKNRNGLQKLGIADANPVAAFVIGAVPAFSDAVFGADPALHRMSTAIAADEVAEQGDSIIFFLTGVTLPGSLQADCCLIHILVYDRVVFLRPHILRIIDDSGDTSFIPCGRFFAYKGSVELSTLLQYF